MGLLRRVRGFLTSDEPRTYECEACGNQYEVVDEEHDPRACPECGAGGATAVPQL